MKKIALPLAMMALTTLAGVCGERVVQQPAASSQRQLMPVEVTANDLITKVYGVLDARLTKQQTLDSARMVLNLIPEEDNFGLWLETDNDYVISYYGMSPDVAAHAEYGPDDRVVDYGFFFLFPYEAGNRDDANRRQTEFSSTLLQEMMDIGVKLQGNELTDNLFDVTGDYGHDAVDVTLLEEQDQEGGGRFILILNVNPQDNLTASVE